MPRRSRQFSAAPLVSMFLIGGLVFAGMVAFEQKVTGPYTAQVPAQPAAAQLAGPHASRRFLPVLDNLAVHMSLVRGSLDRAIIESDPSYVPLSVLKAKAEILQALNDLDAAQTQAEFDGLRGGGVKNRITASFGIARQAIGRQGGDVAQLDAIKADVLYRLTTYTYNSLIPRIILIAAVNALDTVRIKKIPFPEVAQIVNEILDVLDNTVDPVRAIHSYYNQVKLNFTNNVAAAIDAQNIPDAQKIQQKSQIFQALEDYLEANRVYMDPGRPANVPDRRSNLLEEVVRVAIGLPAVEPPGIEVRNAFQVVVMDELVEVMQNQGLTFFEDKIQTTFYPAQTNEAWVAIAPKLVALQNVAGNVLNPPNYGLTVQINLVALNLQARITGNVPPGIVSDPFFQPNGVLEGTVKPGKDKFDALRREVAAAFLVPVRDQDRVDRIKTLALNARDMHAAIVSSIGNMQWAGIRTLAYPNASVLPSADCNVTALRNALDALKTAILASEAETIPLAEKYISGFADVRPPLDQLDTHATRCRNMLRILPNPIGITLNNIDQARDALHLIIDLVPRLQAMSEAGYESASGPLGRTAVLLHLYLASPISFSLEVGTQLWRDSNDLAIKAIGMSIRYAQLPNNAQFLAWEQLAKDTQKVALDLLDFVNKIIAAPPLQTPRHVDVYVCSLDGQSTDLLTKEEFETRFNPQERKTITKLDAQVGGPYSAAYRRALLCDVDGFCYVAAEPVPEKNCKPSKKSECTGLKAPPLNEFFVEKNVCIGATTVKKKEVGLCCRMGVPEAAASCVDAKSKNNIVPEMACPTTDPNRKFYPVNPLDPDGPALAFGACKKGCIDFPRGDATQINWDGRLVNLPPPPPPPPPNGGGGGQGPGGGNNTGPGGGQPAQYIPKYRYYANGDPSSRPGPQNPPGDYPAYGERMVYVSAYQEFIDIYQNQSGQPFGRYVGTLPGVVLPPGHPLVYPIGVKMKFYYDDRVGFRRFQYKVDTSKLLNNINNNTGCRVSYLLTQMDPATNLPVLNPATNLPVLNLYCWAPGNPPVSPGPDHPL